MKNTIIFLIFSVTSAGAQLPNGEQIPYAVKGRFIDDFVSARNASWIVNDDTYAVTFLHQSQTKRATYQLQSESVKLETSLTSLHQVPVPVAEKVSRKFKKYIIDEMWSIQETGGEKLFAFLIRREEKIYNVTITGSGKVVRRIPVLRKSNSTTS